MARSAKLVLELLQLAGLLRQAAQESGIAAEQEKLRGVAAEIEARAHMIRMENAAVQEPSGRSSPGVFASVDLLI